MHIFISNADSLVPQYSVISQLMADQKPYAILYTDGNEYKHDFYILAIRNCEINEVLNFLQLKQLKAKSISMEFKTTKLDYHLISFEEESVFLLKWASMKRL